MTLYFGCTIFPQNVYLTVIFDNKQPVSGVSRGEQRRIYDQRRRDVLPMHGIALIEISYSDLAHDSRKKLLRTVDADKLALRKFLSKYIDTTSTKRKKGKGHNTVVGATRKKMPVAKSAEEKELERIKSTWLYRFTNSHSFLAFLFFFICPIGMMFPISALLVNFMSVEAAVATSFLLYLLYVIAVNSYNSHIQNLERKIIEKNNKTKRKRRVDQDTLDDYTYYCPICGSQNFIEADETHYQCIDCGYTWYKPIDY